MALTRRSRWIGDYEVSWVGMRRPVVFHKCAATLLHWRLRIGGLQVVKRHSQRRREEMLS